MSYSLVIPSDIGTPGLTVKAALVNADGTPHATVRDLAVTEIAQGSYQLVTTQIPYGYLGTIWFYTGLLGSDTNWNAVVYQGQEGSQLLTMLAAIKAATYDSATVSGDAISLADGGTITKTGDNRVTT